MRSESNPQRRNSRAGKPLFAAACAGIALACAIASPAVFAYGTCTAYINADGSVQARRGETDCWINNPVRVSPGVYKVGVNHPIEETTDPATGAVLYTLHASICTVTAGNGSDAASTVKIWPDLKPTTAPRVVPPGHDGTVTYTVRTHAAIDASPLAPTDLDFSLSCVN